MVVSCVQGALHRPSRLLPQRCSPSPHPTLTDPPSTGGVLPAPACPPASRRQAADSPRGEVGSWAGRPRAFCSRPAGLPASLLFTSPLLARCVQVVADQLRLWQQELTRLGAQAATRYSRFESPGGAGWAGLGGRSGRRALPRAARDESHHGRQVVLPSSPHPPQSGLHRASPPPPPPELYERAVAHARQLGALLTSNPDRQLLVVPAGFHDAMRAYLRDRKQQLGLG